MAEKSLLSRSSHEVLTDKNGDSVPRGKTSSSCSILSPIYLKRRISGNICFQICSSLDCSSPIFPLDRRDRVRLTVNGGNLDFQMYRV